MPKDYRVQGLVRTAKANETAFIQRCGEQNFDR